MMIRKILILGFLLFFSCENPNSSPSKVNNDNDSTYSEPVWTNWNKFNSELEYEAVSSIFQDSDGRLLIGNYSKLYEFDGLNFKLINNAYFPGRNISSINEFDNKLILTTTNGLMLVGDEVDTILQNNVKYDLIYNHLLDGSDLYLCTRGGLLLFDFIENTTKIIDLGSFEGVGVRCMIKLNENEFLVGTQGKGVLFYDGTTVTTFLDVNVSEYGGTIYSLLKEDDGTIWVGADRGLVKVNGGNYKVYNDNNSNLPGSSIYKLMLAEDGAIWITTLYKGIARMENDNFEFWTIDNSLLADWNNYTLFETSKNKIWIGTHGMGLQRFNYE